MNKVDQYFQNSAYYNIVRIYLSISGLWPFDTTRRRFAIYFLMLVVVGSGIVFQILGAIDVRHDIFELIETIPALLYSIFLPIKMVFAILTLPKIKLLLIKMRKYCLSQKSTKETMIQNSYALYGRNLSYAYTGYMTFHSIAYTSLALLSRIAYVSDINETLSSGQIQDAQRALPYRVNYFVDINTYYVPIYIHSTVIVMTLTNLLIAFDILYITLIYYCCGLFAALRYRLEYAFELELNNNNLPTKSRTTKVYSNIAYSIRRHVDAIQFIDMMNAVYNFPLFCHLGTIMFTLSVVEYQTFTSIGRHISLLTNYWELESCLMNIFFENWLGQKIIDSSEKVFDAAYNAEWYNMPLAAKKLLVMIIMKSTQPMTLTAGKVLALSYVTFNAVVRTSLSYFMLLLSLQ